MLQREENDTHLSNGFISSLLLLFSLNTDPVHLLKQKKPEKLKTHFHSSKALNFRSFFLQKELLKPIIYIQFLQQISSQRSIKHSIQEIFWASFYSLFIRESWFYCSLFLLNSLDYWLRLTCANLLLIIIRTIWLHSLQLWHLFCFVYCAYISSHYCVREQTLLRSILLCLRKRWCENSSSGRMWKFKLGKSLGGWKIQDQERALVVVNPCFSKKLFSGFENLKEETSRWWM